MKTFVLGPPLGDRGWPAPFAGSELQLLHNRGDWCGGGEQRALHTQARYSDPSQGALVLFLQKLNSWISRPWWRSVHLPTLSQASGRNSWGRLAGLTVYQECSPTRSKTVVQTTTTSTGFHHCQKIIVRRIREVIFTNIMSDTSWSSYPATENKPREHFVYWYPYFLNEKKK